MERRVVITGMGIWSCLGTSLDEVRDSLYNSKCGIVFDQARKDMGFRSALTSAVATPELKKLVPRNMRVYMGEPAQYAYMSTLEALRNANLDEDYIAAHEVGLLFGNDSVADATKKSLDKVYEFGDTAMGGSGAIFQSMNSSVTMNLGCLFKLRGINLTVAGACASGSHAIGLASLLIKQGLQDCIVCGGAQEVNPNAVATFDGISAFSVRESDPTKASRPFDRDRDGLVPGGGAATLVLESYEHAVARGANIIAEVMGYGFSANGAHISSPTVEGPARALEMSLRQAGLKANDIEYINAHATSTHVGDINESKAIAQVIGDLPIPVTSTKGHTGHEMWMAGASEIIYSTLMMKNDFIAANLNYENPDPECATLNYIPEVKKTHFDTFLSNSFGFGGTNSSLIIRNIK